LATVSEAFFRTHVLRLGDCPLLDVSSRSPSDRLTGWY